MTRTITSGARRRTSALAAVGAVAVAALAGSAPALAAPFDVGSANLTWSVPHEPAPGTGTLSNYATTIGHGSVSATAPATGTTITATSLPLSAAGAKYAFGFPGTTTGTPATPAGATGTYDPVTKTGAINFAGTLTFTAHDSTFFSVVNPRLQFDAPQSIRLIANGQVAAGTVGSTDPPVDYGTAAARQTVFALNGSAAITTENPDGSITISNLAPSGTPAAAPVGYLSTSGPFDGIRPWFTIDRPNELFSVTFAPKTVDPDPDPDPDPPVGSDQDLTVNGSVADALSLTLNATSTSLGSFVPGVAANYDASVTGTATSTGPSVLTVQDAGTNPGFLLNGSTPLASALKVCATSSASPTCAYSSLGGASQQLLAFGSSTAATPLTVGLRQAIGAGDALTAGTYGKSLTFTLSAGTP
ncbi:hypothetical protein [Baekduia sp.]|jgi:hypothetical protein|uniref:hypothetical protein n=1 Tax=Baekduia sp. TaxID=2600305 RepID=UPI002E04BF1F|nr:hypothetical protein [Baekduia sp.]